MKLILTLIIALFFLAPQPHGARAVCDMPEEEERPRDTDSERDNFPTDEEIQGRLQEIKAKQQQQEELSRDEESFLENYDPSYKERSQETWDAAADPELSESAEESARTYSVVEGLEIAKRWEDAITRAVDSDASLKNDTNWIPIIDNTKEIIGPTGEKTYRLYFFNQTTEEMKTVISSDEIFMRFKEVHQSSVRKAAKAAEKRRAGEETPDGLAELFLVQAIRSFAVGGEQSTGNYRLDTAFKISQYVNIFAAVYFEGRKIISVVRLVRLMRSGAIEETVGLLGKVASATEIIGPIIMIFQIGLDIYELTVADNPVTTAVVGTQLFFDSLALVGMVAGIVTGTMAEFAGPLEIIVGLGIGISALVGNYEAIAQSAEAFGAFIDKLRYAYTYGTGYVSRKQYYDATPDDKYDDTQFAQVLQPPAAPVVKINFRTGQIEFGNVWITPSRGSCPPTWYGVPESERVDIPAALGWIRAKSLPAKDGNASALEVVLPAYANKWVHRYDYQTLPGSTTKESAGFADLRKLEGKGGPTFDYYCFPSESILYKAKIKSLDTRVKVILPASSLTLIAVRASGDDDKEIKAAKEELQKLHYHLSGAVGGRYTFILSPEQKYYIYSETEASEGDGSTRWTIDASNFTDTTISEISASGFKIGGKRIHLQGEKIPVFLDVVTQRSDDNGGSSVVYRVFPGRGTKAQLNLKPPRVVSETDAEVNLDHTKTGERFSSQVKAGVSGWFDKKKKRFIAKPTQLVGVASVPDDLEVINELETLTFKHQKHQIMGWLCLRGKLPGVIKHLSPLSKNESKYF